MVALTALVALGAGGSARAGATLLVTTDPAAVAAFSSGATVLGFDEGVGNLWPPGSPVSEFAEVGDQYAGCAGVVFSSGGDGPAAAVGTFNTPLQGDAASPWNVLGPTQNFGFFVSLDYDAPIQMRFIDPEGLPVPMARVGAWNDPTGSRIRLSAFDANDVLIASVEADQGFFLGIETDPSGSPIARTVVEHLANQAGLGYTLDNVTLLPRRPADLNRDGVVDGADLGLLLNAWGPCPEACCLGDLTGDGVVDGADLGALLSRWS